MNDRFKFRVGFTVSYNDEYGNDRDLQLFIKGYFSVDCGGAGIVVHSSILEEAINNTDLSLNEKKSVVKYLEANFCENDEYWLIDNLDFLEQCTGLKDKNGKLIFEGDFVKGVDESITLVKYDDLSTSDNNTMYGFYLGYSFDTIGDGLDCEVIGNIHTTPELLK